MKTHRGISQRQEAAAERSLFQAVLTLRSVDECRDFFRDLCTPAELQALAEVVGTSRQVFARLAAVARSLPEADLNDPGRFPWANGIALGPSLVDGRYFEHFHGEHEADVRRWLAASA